MIWLARLLIYEKWRKHSARYGLAGCGSFAVVMAGLVAVAVVPAGHWVLHASRSSEIAVLNRIWIGWVLIGVLVGKDLTWQVRLEDIKVFPVRGFARLYSLGFLLSFASLSLLFLFFSWATAVATVGNLSLTHSIMILPAFGLLVASVRLTVSLVRTCLFQLRILSKAAVSSSAAVILFIAGLNIAAIFRPGVGSLLPGGRFGLMSSGEGTWQPFIFLVGWVVLIAVPDYCTQRAITYCGHIPSPDRSSRTAFWSRLLLMQSIWPGPAFCACLLGWLRNANAVMLLIWGASYGFLWIYFSRPDEIWSFFLFSWMVLVFHSYLRANLLGVDRGGVWLYYMFPMQVQKSLQAKNRTLSVLQGCMILAVWAPGLIHPPPALNLLEWSRIACYACSSLMIGEIIGSLFSIRDPEPVESSTRFSGGMNVGGLVVPFAQLLFLAVFLPVTGMTRRFVSQEACWLELAAIPGALWFMKNGVLSGWIRQTMLNQRETIMSKLSAFSS